MPFTPYNPNGLSQTSNPSPVSPPSNPISPPSTTPTSGFKPYNPSGNDLPPPAPPKTPNPGVPGTAGALSGNGGGVFSFLGKMASNAAKDLWKSGTGFVNDVATGEQAAGQQFRKDIQGAGQAQGTAKQVVAGTSLAGDLGDAIMVPLNAALNHSGVGSAVGGEVKNMLDVYGKLPGADPALIQEGLKHLTTGANDAFDSFSKDHPDAATVVKNIGRVMNPALLLEVEKATGESIPALTETASDLAASGKQNIRKFGEIVGETAKSAKEAISTPLAGVKESIVDKATNMAKDAWEKPSTLPQATYSKAADIYKNAAQGGHDISQTLIENRINPSAHIEGNIFNTADTAEKLRTDAVKTSNDLLRPSLEKANKSVPRTPVAEIIKSAQENIAASRELTAETKDALYQKLIQSQKSLQKQFPDGMQLTDLHDEKILRGINSKFSPVGDISTNIEAQKNNALRDALKTAVEDKAPEDIPVEEVNTELQKQFKAADYLDALHGKKIPVSLKQKMAQTAAKVVGAGVGEVAGGGLLGGVGGYHLGGMAEKLISEIPGKVRDGLLNNVEQTNPEAFLKLKKYLEQ